MTPQDPDEMKTQAEFERLVRTAQVSRMRGDYEQAVKSIVQALQLRPCDLEAREFAADMLLARGKLEQAAEQYKAIYESDKSRVSAEEKYAKALLQIAEGKRQQELLHHMLEHPGAFELPARNPAVAAVLSGIPGLGHFYCGEAVKGLVLFAATSLSWLLFLALRPYVVGSPSERISMFMRDMSAPAVVFLCLGVVLHLYTIVNAAVTAEKMGKSARALTEPK